MPEKRIFDKNEVEINHNSWDIRAIYLEPVAFSYPEKYWFKVSGFSAKRELTFVSCFASESEAIAHFELIASNLP